MAEFFIDETQPKVLRSAVPDVLNEHALHWKGLLIPLGACACNKWSGMGFTHKAVRNGWAHHVTDYLIPEIYHAMGRELR